VRRFLILKIIRLSSVQFDFGTTNLNISTSCGTFNPFK